MKRRGFLGALLAAPIAIKVGSKMPVLLEQTPPVVMRSLARTEYKNGYMTVYDKHGKARVRMGVF
jgi:hypothetical protein